MIADWESRGPKRLDARSTSVCETSGSEGVTRNGPLCFSSKSPVGKIHVMETGPKQCGDRCSTAQVGQPLLLCIPTILSGCKNSQKSSTGRGCASSCDTNLANSTVVFNPLVNVYTKSNFASHAISGSDKPTGPDTPSSETETAKASGMDCFRQSLASEGLSEQAADLIANSRRRGSISNYQSAWRKWASWCVQRQIDPIRCDVNLIANFLAVMFHEGYEYSTINCHRSAISAYHAPINSISVGEHPRICSLMTGVFNLRPTKPCFTFIWDVQKVIDHLNYFPKNEDLPVRSLTHKLTMLLALTSASRGSEICHLNINHMVKTHNSYIFTYEKLTKTRRRGTAPLSVEYVQFSTNPKLCVVSVLDIYLKITQEWRVKGQETQLLLSTLKPHNEVVKSTIAGWIKSVLKDAGIDTSLFSAHSTRSASTSKAMALGLSIEDILKRGNWSGKTTWQRHYHKSIDTVPALFQHTIG